MKKKIEQLLAVFLLLTMVAAIASPINAQAAAPKFQKNIKIWKFPGEPRSEYVFLQNPVPNGKIKKLTNSKPSVAKVTVGSLKNYFNVQPNATGTTKITFQYGGKKFASKITVMKWENPCKSFTIGKKDYAKYFNKSGQFNLSRQKKEKNEKIKIVSKKGWKFLKMESFFRESFEDELRFKKVKNNSKVRLKPNMLGTGLYVWFQNTKTGQKCRLYFAYTNANFPGGNVYDGLITY